MTDADVPKEKPRRSDGAPPPVQELSHYRFCVLLATTLAALLSALAGLLLLLAGVPVVLGFFWNPVRTHAFSLDSGGHVMTPEHIYKKLEVQRYRIAGQVSLISQLRNDGRIDESEKECDTLNDLLEQQTRLLKELWDAQEECGLRQAMH